MIILIADLRFCMRAAALLLAVASFSALAADDVPLDGEAYRLADQAYRELAAGDTDAANATASKALQLRPDSIQLGLLLLDIQQRKGNLEVALQQANTLLARFPNNPQVLVQRGYLAQRQQRHQAAMEDFYTALNQPGLNAEQQRNVRLAWADSALATRQYQVVLDALAIYAGEQDATVQLRRAYAFTGSNDRAALDAFQRAFAAKPGTATQYSDAAYVAKHLGDNATAVSLFRKALDANAQLPADKRAFDSQLEFGYRREIEGMSRTFGAVVNASYQSNGFSPQNNINVMQGGLEAYWQPENIGYQNGKIFQAFARDYRTLYDKSGGVTGSRTEQGSVGARYKPIGDMNMVLTAERLFRIGDLATTDWLLRIGYSTGGGTDIKPYNRDWATWQFYTEGAYFNTAARYIQSMEARYGHSWRMDGVDSRMVATPHLALLGNFDSRATPQTAVGIGPGVSLRYWFRENSYQAPPSWFELTAQYLVELTNTRREKGLMLNAILWY